MKLIFAQKNKKNPLSNAGITAAIGLENYYIQILTFQNKLKLYTLKF